MKSTKASVGVVPTQGKKEIKEGIVVDEIEEDSHQMRNEMVFFSERGARVSNISRGGVV